MLPVIFALVCYVSSNVIAAPTPVVIWHGLGDSCCNPLSMGRIKKIIEQNGPEGVYVKSLMFGSNIVTDTEKGFFANMNDLVDEACDQLKKDPRIKGSYHSVGFSQGGLFLRALAQRCDYPVPKSVVSIGGPQHGVFGLPHCPASAGICNTVRRLLNLGAYVGFVQNTLVQAQYWDDPYLRDDFKNKNIFLADINCARGCNQTKYKQNLSRLESLVLVKFLKDTMVVPKDSEWFGYYPDNNTTAIVDWTDSYLYKEDPIGLRSLDEEGKLHFLTVDADHLRITTEFFIDEIIKKYFN
ncbi:unnamed protein product [Bursaphelenchus xylophilus]|uniref:Palmitoyl-protein thioesterase 1 n=1 Tax=Bursaphelenchus xylophilus TaxID=6326 RepID=A0A1I7RSA7_BURXY|nr:unnamed protein product [Bursaphelenchus xylophilus]CAG9123082.1 unnamed protein product [Bursaphelenchus xylophilus]